MEILKQRITDRISQLKINKREYMARDVSSSVYSLNTHYFYNYGYDRLIKELKDLLKDEE